MGILNLTPDSFSGDGMAGMPDAALARVRAIECEGADILDIGAESSRPGAISIGAEEEWERLGVVLERCSNITSLAVSIDTTKATIARRAAALGACIINDVSGLADPDMAGVAAEVGAWLVLVHCDRIAGGVDPMSAVHAGLQDRVRVARRAGVRDDHIIVDPGLGFGKGWRENFAILRRLRDLRELGYPVLVGPSRKGMIGRVLGVSPADRTEGTLALTCLSAFEGADIVRVHDVRVMTRAVRMADAITRVQR
jgi:dihydropteroate synthase